MAQLDQKAISELQKDGVGIAYFRCYLCFWTVVILFVPHATTTLRTFAFTVTVHKVSGLLTIGRCLIIFPQQQKQ